MYFKNVFIHSLNLFIYSFPAFRLCGHVFVSHCEFAFTYNDGDDVIIIANIYLRVLNGGRCCFKCFTCISLFIPPCNPVQ